MDNVVQAVLRHVYTAVGSAIAVAGVFGLSSGDGTAIVDAVHKIGDGFVAITTGIGVIVPIVMAAWAGIRSTKTAQVVNIVKSPDLDVVPLTPEGAKLVNDANKKVTS